MPWPALVFRPGREVAHVIGQVGSAVFDVLQKLLPLVAGGAIARLIEQDLSKARDGVEL